MRNALLIGNVSIPADKQSAEATADESAHTAALDTKLPHEAVSHTMGVAQNIAHASNPTLPLCAAAIVSESTVLNTDEHRAPKSQQLPSVVSASNAWATGSSPAEASCAERPADQAKLQELLHLSWRGTTVHLQL